LATYGYTYDDVGNRLTAAETLRQPGASVSMPDAIFANGFESGNLSGWSSSSTGSGTLTVTTAAAMGGTYGMQALINSSAARYVQDTIPNAEPRYRARFYFDPNPSTMANNNAYYLFYGYTGSSTVVLRFEFGFTTAGGYRARVNALNNASTWTNSAWVNVTDTAHYFELDWQSAVSGRVDWWIDGVAQAAVTGFDNSARRIDQVRLGTVAGLDSGTTGTVFFDAFESRRQTYIGSATALPDAIFAADFESGGFGYWSANTGVSVTTAASLAPAGTRGMSVTLASATTAKYVTDSVPGVEPRYRARFYLDPNSTTMANNADHVLFYGDSGTTPVLQLDLGYTTAGGYRLRTRIRDNASIWNNSAWVNISDAPHLIEFDWQSGISGSLAWWIDEAPQPAPNSINNSSRKIDRVRLGAVANVDSTTNGTLYIDAFESRRQSYIGPMGGGLATQNITYDYDPLYRLTTADYDTGPFFHYTYDAVGNRLTQTTHLASNSYVYDIANRLTSIDSVPYTWSDNGNLLSDGVSTYTYDHANRLASVTQGANNYTFAYSGLGDRLRQTVNGVPINYTLDLAAGLTQVLSDGTNAYLYGVARLGEEQPGGWQYHLGDALGSVRQLADAGADVGLVRSYEPSGSSMGSAGLGDSRFQFAGEQRDQTEMLYLRARYYAAGIGLFASRDLSAGELRAPMTFNHWLYALANPVNITDPNGLDPWWCQSSPNAEQCCWAYSANTWQTYERYDRTVKFIHNQMIVNASSATVSTIRTWIKASCSNPEQASFAYGWALLAWLAKVRDHGPWDHKPRLREMLDLDQDPTTKQDDDFYFPIRGDTAHEYYYDIWSNVHYGYVGSAAAFDPAILQWAQDLNIWPAGKGGDPGDNLSVQIGIDLWSSRGLRLTADQLRASIVGAWPQFVRVQPEGSAKVISWTNGR